MNEPSPKTVLVAEEDDDVREGLMEELKKEGYRVVGLEDGLELRDYLEAAYSQDSTVSAPAVVITDATLPGVGGIEVCEELHAHEMWPPFIVLANHDELEVFEAAERAGADFVFDKPIDVEELRNVVSWLASGND
jgi:two-component system response regulator PrrA